MCDLGMGSSVYSIPTLVICAHVKISSLIQLYMIARITWSVCLSVCWLFVGVQLRERGGRVPAEEIVAVNYDLSAEYYTEGWRTRRS